MKKIYLLILGILPIVGFAQPTIVQSSLPVAGLVYIMGTDAASGAMLPRRANQTWDYSALLNTQSDTTGFMDAAGTVYQSSFPTANLATYSVSSDIWAYFTTNSTGFYVNGIAGSGTPFGGVLAFDPPQLYGPVPFTYNDAASNISRIVIDTMVLTFNAQFVRNITDSIVADGWGSLITPTTTYPSVLRAKTTEITWDSAYYDPSGTGNYVPVPSGFFTPTVSQTTIYRWLQNQQPSYIMGITADSLGDSAVSSEYLISYVILSDNESTSNHSALTIYPNPVSQTLYLQGNLNTESMFIITNSLGQEIEKRKLSNENHIQVDVKNYENGIYQLTLISDSGKRSGRFTVRH